MIGLIVIGLAVGWLVLAGVLAGGIAREFAPEKIGGLVAILLFPLIVAVPFIDEIIGRWQFGRLCEREATVWIAPTAIQVRAARRVGPDFVDREGFLIPVREQPIVYVDADTGKPFYTVKAFHTPGGMIMRLGLNMGSSKACWPKNWTHRVKMA
jgi:hypothetical protein